MISRLLAGPSTVALGQAEVRENAAPQQLLTGAVLTAGPAGWLVLGAAVAGLSVVQRRGCVRRLDTVLPVAAPAGGRRTAPQI
ncbi:hypothetical protein AB0N06_07030 [Streptomyces sp. NPDC051020]|uniref:hypothetical protein n=1 Tax=Streptomyces sp. NPDC051020 TaxID=3155409 RepID=UPI0034367E65